MAMLEQSWSTEHLQPGSALSYWRDVICENLLQMRVQSSQEGAFFGHIEKRTFGPIKANFISVSEQKVWRERTAAGNAKDHLFDFPQGVEALVLEIRRDWLRGWLPAPEDSAARLIEGRSGCSATSDSTGSELPKSPGIAGSASQAISLADSANDSVRRRAHSG